MPIPLIHEAAGRYYLAPVSPENDPPFGVIEDCLFCGSRTRFWHENTNNPVCPACSGQHRVGELPDHGTVVRKKKRERPTLPVATFSLTQRERTLIALGKWPLDGRGLQNCREGWLAWVSAAQGQIAPSSLKITEPRAEGVQAWLSYLLDENPHDLPAKDRVVLEDLAGRFRAFALEHHGEAV